MEAPFRVVKGKSWGLRAPFSLGQSAVVMLSFRPAKPDDVPLLCSLASRIWGISYAGIISRDQMEYMLGWMYSPKTLLAEMASGVCWEFLLIDGTESGFLSLTFGPGGVAKLNKLYLSPELHGRGIGQGMLARVDTIAREGGASEIRLQVNKANRRAQRSYERAGYAIVDAAVFDIGGGHVMDDFIMMKVVSDPPLGD